MRSTRPGTSRLTHTDEGLVAAQAIRAGHPEIGVLVLSQYVEPSYAMRLIQDHPERVGYLLKERVFDIATVVDALRRIMEGERSSTRRSSPVSSAGAAGPIRWLRSLTGNEKSWG